MRELRAARAGQKAAPVIVVALHGALAHLCGPEEKAPIRQIDAALAERVLTRALDEPDRHHALRRLRDTLPGLDGPLPGVRNEGLLSDHVLRHGTRDDPAWPAALARGKALLGRQEEALLRGLGFRVEKIDALTSLVRAGEHDRAVAVLLRPGETPEGAAARFQALSPVSWGLNEAERRNLPWLFVLQEDRVRLYPAAIGVGVGRRGRTETWVELRTGLLREEDAGLLWMLVSAEALTADGSIETLLAASGRYAARLAERLRERIYDRVVPRLCMALANARNVAAPTADDLRLTYSMALTVLFRLLFIAYAEDRDLLPYGTNEAYRRASLKTIARELHDGSGAFGEVPRMWREVETLCDAVRDGDPGLGVPAYGGGLFMTDPALSAAGAALAAVRLPDREFAPVLRDLLLDLGGDLSEPRRGPVDFRSLKVREFGTIYEGLLESELAVAETDLALRRQGKEQVYVPARDGEAVAVARGGVYLHGKSGARKSSGSYFTPAFAVDHLLDAVLTPALAAHVARLETMDDESAAAAFFDLRIADIAMGSGHFLVAAVDRVEQALSKFLSGPPVAGGDAGARGPARRGGGGADAARPGWHPGDRGRAGAAPADRAAVHLRRRSQPAGGGSGAAFDLDSHLRARAAAQPAGPRAGGGQCAGRRRHGGAVGGAVRGLRHGAVPGGSGDVAGGGGGAFAPSRDAGGRDAGGCERGT